MTGPHAGRPRRGGALDDKTIAIRCDHDGLKMGEVKDGHLILRTKHHGETHFKIVQLRKLAELTGDTNERDGHG